MLCIDITAALQALRGLMGAERSPFFPIIEGALSHRKHMLTYWPRGIEQEEHARRSYGPTVDILLLSRQAQV